MSRIFMRPERDNNWYYESAGQPKKSMRKQGVPAGEGGKLAAQMLQNKWDQEAFYSSNGLVNPHKQWGEYKEEYLTFFAPPNHAENTFNRVKTVARDFEAIIMPGPKGAQRLMVTFTDEDIIQFRKVKLASGLSARSVDREEAYLNGMFQRALRKGFLKEDPFADVPKLRFTIPEPRHLSLPEANNFLDILNKNSPGYLLLGLMAYETGMRVGELIHLRIEDVDFMKGLAHLLPHNGLCVCHQCDKQETPGWTGKAGVPRKLPLSPKANALLLQLWQTRKSGNIFPLATNTVMGIFKRTFFSVGIKGNACTHIFRHTLATHCDQAGIRKSVTMRLLGHSNKTTTDGYTHIGGDEELQRQYQQLLDWRAGNQAAQISAVQ